MVVAKQSPYEEFRLKRVEENKKRMETLNLSKSPFHLCQDFPSFDPFSSRFFFINPYQRFDICVMKASYKTLWQKKKSTTIPRTTGEKQMVIVRRSSRLSNSSSPSPVYKEVVVQRVYLPRRVCKGRDFSNRVYVSEDCRDEAMSRAEKLLADLGNDFPFFLKSMLPSHVSSGFWLGLPALFCRTHLQKKDGVITLIDEQGEEFETVYLANKTGLSGGWMCFAVAHNLAYGDALVFQLVRHATFKVYITRVASSGESPKI